MSPLPFMAIVSYVTIRISEQLHECLDRNWSCCGGYQSKER